MAQKQSAERKTKITPEYVNNKLEQILSDLFDRDSLCVSKLFLSSILAL